MLHLKELRKKLGISQTTVANALGISRQSYNFYENGKRDPDTEMLKNIAEYFNVSTDYLLGREAATISLMQEGTEENNIVLSPEFLEIYALYEKLPLQKKKLVLEMAKAMAGDKI